MAGKWILIAVLLSAVAGCDDGFRYTVPEPDWATAPQDHVCTAEQMGKAEREAKFCQENTEYFGRVCYGQAIIRNCTRRATQPLPPPNEE